MHRAPVGAVFVVALYKAFGLPKPKLQPSMYSKGNADKPNWYVSASVKVQTSWLQNYAMHIRQHWCKEKKHGFRRPFATLSQQHLIKVHSAELLSFKMCPHVSPKFRRDCKQGQVVTYNQTAPCQDLTLANEKSWEKSHLPLLSWRDHNWSHLTADSSTINQRTDLLFLKETHTAYIANNLTGKQNNTNNSKLGKCGWGVFICVLRAQPTYFWICWIKSDSLLVHPPVSLMK